MRFGFLTIDLLAGVVAVTGSVTQASAQQSTPTENASDVSFDATRPPRGTVADPKGAPIGGASVYFKTQRGTLDAMQWRDTILRTTTLPRVRSSKDGEFFVPLTHLHRLFSPTSAGRISLVVEKEGYHSWIEPLTAGLRGYLGSKVVLRPIVEADRFTIEVKNPKPGMLVRVHRFGSSVLAGVDYEQWLEVPKSGKVNAAMSFVPSPITFGVTSNFGVPVGIEVQLVFPGRTTRPKSIEYGQKTIVIGDGVSSTRFVCVLQRRDKKKLVEPRGLYRCADHISRWFPVDPDNVVESTVLPLFALDAKDCLAANVRYIDPSVEKILLDAVPNVSDRMIELRDDAGATINDAQVYFFDLEKLPAHTDGLRLGSARARRRLNVEKGRIDLGGRALPGPGFLWIHAPGFKAHLQFEPRKIAGTERISLGTRRKSGKLQLQVVDDDGRPLAGVHVGLNGRSTEYGALLSGIPRTGADGMVTIERLPSGGHSIRLFGSGLTEVTTMVGMRGTRTVNLKSTLSRVKPFRILIVDDDGKPIPFRGVRTYATYINNVARLRTGRSNFTVTSDSLGRILYTELPAGAIPRITDLLNNLVRKAMQPVEAGKINKVPVAALETVLMQIPNAPAVRECLMAANRTSNRTLVVRKGCAVMLVRFPKNQDDATLSIYLRGSPPIRLSGEIVAAAREKQGPGGILFLDQRKETRHVKLEFANLGAASAEDVRIELPGMNFVRNKPYLYGNSGLQIRPAGKGLWTVGLRDHGSYAARVMHPEFLLGNLDIPSGDGGKAKPLKVEMKRGVPIVFRLKSSIPLQPNYQFNLYVHTSTNQMVLYQREKLEESNFRKIGKDRWELRLPFALEPGKYYFSVRVYNTQLNLSRRLFTVPAEGPFVVEVNNRTARGPKASVIDIKALTIKIDRLQSTADALRKMGKTDEKSKERLTKVLKGIEAQLETHKKELVKRRAAEAEEKAEARRKLILKRGEAEKKKQGR